MLYIDNNYQAQKPADMGVHLKIRAELVRAYMHDKGYPSMCRKSLLNPLSETHKKFIRANSAKMSINQMSNSIKRGFVIIKKFIEAENLPYELRPNGRPKKAIKIITYRPQIKKPFVRPPAQYSNPDWQSYGEQLLNN